MKHERREFDRLGEAADEETRVAGSLSRVASWLRDLSGRAGRLEVWPPIKRIGQSLANLLVVASAIGIIVFCSTMTTPKTACEENDRSSKIRPAAFIAEEIFLPRSLVARSKDDDLRDILRGRDIGRLDRYVESHGLRDAWFLVRYRGIEADGSTWKSMDSNFECKRYHVHSSSMGEIENTRNNLEILARALARAAGQEPDAFLSAGQARDMTVRISRFDTAKVIPIPDEAIGIEHVGRADLDAWRGLAAAEAAR